MKNTQWLHKLRNKLFYTGFFHIFGANVANKIIAFFSGVILIRLLSKAEYGVYSYALNIFSLILLFQGAGLGNAVLQLCSEHPHEVRRNVGILKYSMSKGSILNVVMIGIVIIVCRFIPFGIEGTASLLSVMILMLPIVYLDDILYLYIRTKKQNQKFAYLSMLQALLICIFSAIGAYFGNEEGVVIGRFSAYTVLLVIVFLVSYRVDVQPVKAIPVSNSDQKQMWKIGLISAFNNGMSQLLYLVDVFLVGVIIKDSTIVASYKVATTIPTALSFIPASLAVYVYPYFAAHIQDGKWCLNKYKQIVLGIGVCNFIIAAGLIILSPYIIAGIFGAQYLDAVGAFRILSLSYFFSGTFRVIAGNLLVTQKRLKFNFFIAVSSGLMNIVLDIILIQYLGSSGAALATFVILLITSILNVGYLVKVFKDTSKNISN